MKKYLLAGAVLAVSAHTPAYSEESAALDPIRTQSRRAIEEIVVTAVRRESSAQDTPVAVTALSDTDRENLGLRSIQDIAIFTPGVSYQGNPNRFTIRGIGRLDNAVGSDPGVATYYDGTYTSETAAIGQIPLFIERTEVLRGPQGTLFGRNSVGGLVNVISRRPQDQFGADVQTSFNDYNQRFYAASVTGPVPGLASTRYRVNAWKSDRDGYQNNKGSGPDGGSDDSDFIELQLESDITDRLYAWMKYNQTYSHGEPSTGAMRAPYASGVLQGGLVPFPEFGLTGNPSERDNRDLSTDHDGKVGVDNTYQVILNLSYALDAAEIKYIGSYAQYDFFFSADADRTSRDGFDYPLFDATGAVIGSIPVSTAAVNYIEENKRYISHELQLITTNDSIVQFIGGLYYYEEEIEQPYILSNPFEPALRNPITFGFAPTAPNPTGDYYYQLGFVESEQFAAYGQFDVAVTDALNLTFGLRYSKDEKDGYEEQRLVLYNPLIAPGVSFDISASGTGGPTSRRLSNDWSAVSGKVGFDLRVTDNAMVYGNVARGFKSGGMRLGQLEGYDGTRADLISQTISPFVEEETVWSYEVGLKTDLLDKQLRFNTAAFYYDYQDQQAPVSFRDGNGVAQQDFINIPKSTSYGIEFETTWFATDNLQLIANYGYLNTEVSESDPLLDTNFTTPLLVDVEGNSLPKAPEHKLTLIASYFMDTRLGSFTFTGNWSYVSKQYSALFERDLYEVESYTQAGARVTYNTPGESFRAILGVSNITDQDAPINSLTAAGIENGFARIEEPDAPRVISLELTKKFGAGAR